MDTGTATVIAAAIGGVASIAVALVTRTARRETPDTIGAEGSAGAPSSKETRPVHRRTRWLYFLEKGLLWVIYAISAVLSYTFVNGLVVGDVSGVYGAQQQTGVIGSGFLAAIFIVIALILRKREFKLRLGIHIVTPIDGERVSTQRQISMRGTYRMYPRPADRLVAFHREGTLYYPQSPISFDRKNSLWEASAWVDSHRADSEHELIIARINRDLEIAQRFYSRVHGETDKWIGIEMADQPPGFEILASVRIVLEQRQ
jgi:hypothetical protein